MLGTLLLAAALSTPRVCTPLINFSRAYGSFVAQDEYALYRNEYDGGSTSITRIPKDGGTPRTVVTSKLTIWAVDVDGPHVYFGTANRDVFRHDFTSDHLEVATIFGGEPATLVDHTGWIHWIGHDATHIYWFEAGGVPFTPEGVYWRIRRFEKRSGVVETLADGLHIHPTHISVAMTDHDLFVEGFDHLYVIPKDGSPIDSWWHEGRVFVHGGAVYSNASSDGYGVVSGFPQWMSDDGVSSRAISLPGYGAHAFGIAGDLLFYSSLFGDIRAPYSFIRHICTGEDENAPVDLPGSFAILGDSCNIYRIGDKHDVVTLPGPGDFRIDSITPAHAAPGTVVTINGSGFDRAFSLTVDGVEAAAYAVSSTEIKAIVPHVASSSFANVVAVHNPDGRCTGAYFAIE